MGEVFLGKPWHWGLLLAVSVLLALVGFQYLHTSAFNLFTTITLTVGVVTVSAVVFGHKPGERVTRDPILGIDTSADPT